MTQPSHHLAVIAPHRTAWVMDILSKVLALTEQLGIDASQHETLPMLDTEDATTTPRHLQHTYLLIGRLTPIVRMLENNPLRTPYHTSRMSILAHTCHPVATDMLRSFHVRAVITERDLRPEHGRTHDTTVLINVARAITSAFADQTTGNWQSGLTYMELRILRQFIRLAGEMPNDAEASSATVISDSIAKTFSISRKTVNSHFSNVLAKLGFDTRAELLEDITRS